MEPRQTKVRNLQHANVRVRSVSKPEDIFRLDVPVTAVRGLAATLQVAVVRLQDALVGVVVALIGGGLMDDAQPLCHALALLGHPEAVTFVCGRVGEHGPVAA